MENRRWRDYRVAYLAIADLGIGKSELYTNQEQGGGTGDGNLTETTEYPTGTTDERTTDYVYDWRDRQVGELDGATADGVGIAGAILYVTTYDNLDEPVSSLQFAAVGLTPTAADLVPYTNDPYSLLTGIDSSLLRAMEVHSYDDQGRVFSDYFVSVDDTGTIFDTTGTNYFYDARGNLVGTQAPGGLWTKNVFDGADRLISQSQTDAVQWAIDENNVETNGYVLDDDVLYDDATTVTGDHVLTQTSYQYDGNGNEIFSTTAERLNTDPTDDSDGLGALEGPMATDGLAARVSYEAFYYDAADRLVDSVDLGTNGGTALTTRPSLPSRSDTVLVTSYIYDAAGWNDSMTDPNDIVTQYTHDALNRLTQQVNDYGDFPSPDYLNQTTDYTYDGDNHLVSEFAVEGYSTDGPPWGATTDYIYGVTTDQGSAINSNDLLYQTEYPDPTGGYASSDQANTYTYDALGETATFSDRNGTTHQYSYDALGRLSSDYLSAVGSGVDNAVRKVMYAYNSTGQLQYATSYNASDTVLNQVEETYDGLGQVASDAQAHSGTVGGSTPSVGYTYSDYAGDRPDTTTYPDGTVLQYYYGQGFDSNISRLSEIDNGQSYEYLGLDTPVQTTDANGIQLNVSFDQFGRVSEQNWTNSSSTSIDDFQYGYDRDGNVFYQLNGVSGAGSQSELFGYDNLNRLTSFAHGTLNSGHTAISGTASETESWTLDSTGNWSSQTVNGTDTSRENNTQNQATVIGSNTLLYDSDGNTTTDEQGHTLVYDGWNRLVAVEDGFTVLASYKYDALGRRITETYGDTTTDLYYSKSGQVIEERQGGTVTAQYMWSPFGASTLIERDTTTSLGGALSVRYYVEQEASGSVTSLSDTTGSILVRYLYKPYGTSIQRAANWGAGGSGFVPYSFQGGRVEVATGLIHFGARDYDPATDRWMQQDSAGYINGSNLYQFVESNPVKFVDPSGRDRTLPRVIVVGGGGTSAPGTVPMNHDVSSLLPRPTPIMPPGSDGTVHTTDFRPIDPDSGGVSYTPPDAWAHTGMDCGDYTPPRWESPVVWGLNILSLASGAAAELLLARAAVVARAAEAVRAAQAVRAAEQAAEISRLQSIIAEEERLQSTMVELANSEKLGPGNPIWTDIQTSIDKAKKAEALLKAAQGK